MHVEPYLDFNGRCEEALEFYKRALGAEVNRILRHKEAPEPPRPGMVPPGSENKILHASFRVGSTNVMVSDGRCEGKPAFQGIMLSIMVADNAAAERLFSGLSDG